MFGLQTTKILAFNYVLYKEAGNDGLSSSYSTLYVTDTKKSIF